MTGINNYTFGCNYQKFNNRVTVESKSKNNPQQQEKQAVNLPETSTPQQPLVKVPLSSLQASLGISTGSFSASTSAVIRVMQDEENPVNLEDYKDRLRPGDIVFIAGEPDFAIQRTKDGEIKYVYGYANVSKAIDESGGF